MLQDSANRVTNYETIKIYHRLILGDQDDRLKNSCNDDYDMKLVIWILFFLSTIILTIVLLNLLIAFIGDSYEKIIS